MPPFQAPMSSKRKSDQDDISSRMRQATENSNKSNAAAFWMVQWQNPQYKKHKTWDGDAVLVVHDTKATLYDLNGGVLSSGKANFPMFEGKNFSVGGKEIELDSAITKEDYFSGRCFGSVVAADKPSAEKNGSLSKKFTSLTMNKASLPSRSSHHQVTAIAKDSPSPLTTATLRPQISVTGPPMDSPSPRHHCRLLVVLTVLSRLLTAVVLPLFDAFPRLLPVSPAVLPFLRWDTFHFLHIAHHGYTQESNWAFLPALPILMRTAAARLAPLLLAPLFVALACDSTLSLYALSRHHLRSPHLAFLAAVLSLLPSSPVTLQLAAYNEPFFTALSYRGMLCCARQQWPSAAVFFALASCFRSNGIFLAGFILWGLFIQPLLVHNRSLSLKSLCYASLLTALIFTPFVYHNLSGYMAFCNTTHPPQWCSNFPPVIYSHVQSKYWNSGFLKYWTFQQIPNFLLAAPPLMAIFAFSFYYLGHAIVPHIFPKITEPLPSHTPAPFLCPSVTPHAIHAIVFSATLLFASHTQIVLRLAASMPLTYWAAAWLLSHHPNLGRLWLIWSVLWGQISVVLWAAFLPPA